MVVVGTCDNCGHAIERSDIPYGSGLITCSNCDKVLGDSCGC